MVLTNNPGNPPIKNWIREEINILHRDPKLRKIFPEIDVITRQNRNIKPPGNFQYHNRNRCVTCARRGDNVQEYKSKKTGRTYKIRRHYTCQSDFVSYLVDCHPCPAQYVGQTTKSMSYRHQRHRAEIKSAADGI